MSTSIKDIANALGMSISTVSLALNDQPRVSPETRRRVKEKAIELNYVKNGLAADLKRKKTNMIVLIVNDASLSFFSDVIYNLQQAVSLFGYDLLICTTYGNHLNTAERMIREQRADAAIIYTNTVADKFIQEYARPNFPILVLGRKVEGENIYSFSYHRKNILVTTEYLIQCGHRRIAFVKGSSSSLGTSRSFNEFKDTLNKYDIPFHEELVFEADGSSTHNGYEIAKQILPRLDEIDAIQFSTDDIAIGAMVYFNEQNVDIPGKVSIVGKNNSLESRIISPKLTTFGRKESNYLFYEGLVHHLITIIENNEQDYLVKQQLNDYLTNYREEEILYIRESVLDKRKQRENNGN